MEEKIITENGIELYTYKNEASHGFFISLFLRAGSMYETSAEAGITHFFEHTAIRNVNKQMNGELYSLLDRAGLEFNASTFSEMVQFYISGAKENFSVGAEVITKLFSPIILSREEIDTERRRIKAEIRENDDKTSLGTFTNTILNEGTSLANSILGSVGSVNKITADRLEKYRRRVFTRPNVFFYVSGNFSEDDLSYLSRLISEYSLPFCEENNANVAPVPTKFGKRECDVRIKGADFTMVRFTFDIDMSKSSVPETDLIYDMLFSGYSSPFFMEMSEQRGLFYDVSGGVERYKNIGYLYFTYELREKDLEQTLLLTVKILKDFKEKLQNEDRCMKASYVDNGGMLLDEVRDLNFTMAYDNHIMDLGYKSVEDRSEAYKKVTPERIREVACQIFTPENLTVTVKGNKKRISPDKIKNIMSAL